MALHSSSSLVYLLVTITVLVLQATAESKAQIKINEGRRGNFRIIGGSQTVITKFPWQVLIQIITVKGGLWYTHGCGGSIIANNWILTAAHCFPKDKSSARFKIDAIVNRIRIYAGVTQKSKRSTDRDVQYNEIKKDEFKEHIFIDKDFGKRIGKWSGLNNDIALVKLKKPLSFNSKVQKIDLASVNDFDSSKEAIASGWGRISDDGTKPDYLQYVSGLNLISRSECARAWPRFNSIICHKTRNKTVCIGDSGGPLITGRGSSNGPPYVQIGITSFGDGRCERYPTAGYTDVAKFRDWIRQTMSRGSKDGDCSDTSSTSTCEMYEGRGYCAKGHDSADVTAEQCMKTCNLCGGTGCSDGDCTDTGGYCDYFKDLGYCHKEADTMAKNCKKTCNLCGGSSCSGPEKI